MAVIRNVIPGYIFSKRATCAYALAFSLTLVLPSWPVFASIPEFSDVASVSGVDHPGTGLFGGGAAWIDFNNDGYADLFVPNGDSGGPSVFSPGGGANRLYQNNQDGGFTEIAVQANVEMLSRTCTGAVVGDVNNDGFDDIFVTCGTPTTSTDPAPYIPLEQNALLLNKGDGTFEDISATAGLLTPNERNPSYAAAFGDLDNDGDLDLYVGNYIVRVEGATGPVRECVPNQLFINNGDNTFSDMSQAYAVSGAGCTLGVMMSDFDFDGDLDIFEVNDFGPNGWPPNAVYRNNGPGLPFTNVASDVGLEAVVFGMGMAVGDYDNDLDFDYYISSMGGNVLYKDDGTHSFTDVAEAAGVLDFLSHPDYPQVAVAWGSVFLDADNDGFLDLYVANGGTGFSGDGCVGVLAQCINRFYQNNQNGTFTDVTYESGTEDESGSPLGVAVADYDRDGDVDIFVTNLFEVLPNLYRNDTPNPGNFLEVSLNGSVSNRRGIGAKVTLKSTGGSGSMSQLREIHAGSSHGSSHELMAHFGLPAGSIVEDLSIEWPKPDGLKEVQVLRNVSIDQLLEVKEVDVGSIWPESVPAGQGVIVKGSNFCKDECYQSFPAEVQVQVNGVAAQVTWVTQTMLVLATSDYTPIGSGSITVISPEGGVISAETLTVLPPLPVVSSINPDTLPIGQGGFVAGDHFCLDQCYQRDPTEVGVDINGVSATVTWVTPTLIVFIVTEGTPLGTWSVTVTAPGGQVTKVNALTVVEALSGL